MDRVTDCFVWQSIRKANGGQEETERGNNGMLECWKDGGKKFHPISPFGEPFGPELTAEGLMSCRFRKEGGMGKAGENWGT